MALTKIKDDLHLYKGDYGELIISVSKLSPNTEYNGYLQINMPTKVLLPTSGTTDANGEISLTFTFPKEETKNYDTGSFPYVTMVCNKKEKHTVMPTPTKKGRFHVYPAQIEED